MLGGGLRDRETFASEDSSGTGGGMLEASPPPAPSSSNIDSNMPTVMTLTARVRRPYERTLVHFDSHLRRSGEDPGTNYCEDPSLRALRMGHRLGHADISGCCTYGQR
jgi:hypothetical protein